MTEERRLAAIMFSDVCGFSRIMGADEQRALAIVQMAASTIESGAEVYSGRVIKRMGDGMLLEFPSAVNAVRCAVEVQRAVSRHNAEADENSQFQLRIGIHVGDVVVAGGDIMGDGVNVASRIEPLAEPGGICISRDVFDLVRNKVTLEAVHIGPHELKNISRQVEIYRVLIDAMEGQRGTVVHEKVRTVRRGVARKVLFVCAAVAVLAVLAAGGAALRKAGFLRNAEREFRKVEKAAREHAEAGRYADALKALESYPAVFKETSWQGDINRISGKIGRLASRQEIEDRLAMFLHAVQDDNRAVALKFIDPALLRKVDGTALWNRLRMAAFVLKLGQVRADSFKVDTVEFVDNDAATVKAKMFVKNRDVPGGAWQDIPPQEWKRIQGAWFMCPEPPGPSGSGDKPFLRPLFKKGPMPGMAHPPSSSR